MAEGTRDHGPVDNYGRKILRCACDAESAYVNEFPYVLPHKMFHIQVLFQDAAVVDDDASDVTATEPAGDSNVAWQDGHPLFEEEIRLNGAQEKSIIIK